VEACAACGNEVASPPRDVFDTRFGVPEFYAITTCSRCQLEQTVPKPNPVELKRLYESFYNFGGEKGTRYTSMRQRFLLSPLYRLWMWIDGDISFHQYRGTGRLLDIGCNEGRGLRLYKANGYTAEGLEWNETAAAVARAQGFIVYSEGLEQFKPPHLYDVVLLSNVLEHALDPGDMVRRIAAILAPNGQLWISCPNNQSWLRRLFGRFWINWHVPFHIVHFSKATLTRLVEQNGFRVERVRNETPALWFTQSLLARLFAKPRQPTRQLRSIYYVMPLLAIARCFLFPLFWLANWTGHGDCLVVMARKKDASL